MGERRAHNQRQINTEALVAASNANGRTEKFEITSSSSVKTTQFPWSV